MKYRIILILAILLYLASLALPSMVFQPSVFNNPNHLNSTWYGYDVLTFGAASGFVSLIIASTQSAHIGSVVGDFGVMLVSLLLSPIFIVPFAGLGGAAWYGNVLFVASLISLKKKHNKIALVLSGLAVGIGLLAFTYSNAGKDFELGVLQDVLDHLAIGYYVWETALVVLAIYCVAIYLQPQSSQLSQTIPNSF